MDPRLELAEMLLRKAKDDLAMVRRLLDDPATPDWGIGFHVQQAVEKAIKSVLCFHSVEYPRTHSISLLLDLLGEGVGTVPLDREALVKLSPYGVLFRYDDAGPSDLEMADLQDRALLLTLAVKVVQWAEHARGG